MKERFWLEDPTVLIANLRFIPRENLTIEENLNAVTRLVILVAIILALAKWKHWLTFLLFALLLIILTYVAKVQEQDSMVEHFDEDMSDFTFYKSRTTSPVSADNSQSDLENEDLAKLYVEILLPAIEEGVATEEELSGVSFIPEYRQKEKTAEQHMRDFYAEEDEYDPTDFTREALFHAIL